MFCSQCGMRVVSGARFCSNCGAPLANASSDVAQVTNKPPLVTDFGSAVLRNAVNRWWLPFKGKGPFPSGYEWLEQRNTLLICPQHLVLLQGDEKRSAALDIISAMGLVGGVVGSLRSLKDVVTNRKFELSSALATRLFNDRLMVWCRKSDALIWQYHEKPWMFIKSSSEQLYCQFNSKAGVLHACAACCGVPPNTLAMVKVILKGLGVESLMQEATSLKKVPEAMAVQDPISPVKRVMPNPSFHRTSRIKLRKAGQFRR